MEDKLPARLPPRLPITVAGAQSREEVAMRLPLHAQLVRADPRLTRFRICAGAVRSLVQMSHREVHRSHRHVKKMGSGQFELSHFWFVLPGSFGHNSSRERRFSHGFTRRNTHRT